MYLVEWISRRMKKKKKRERKREKMKRENFLEGIWLGGEEGERDSGAECFLLRLIKKLSLQNGEKSWVRGSLMGK